MAVKKINSLNAHQNPATNENEFDVENYLNVNWEKIIDVVDNNADELTNAQTAIKENKEQQEEKIQSLQQEISDLEEDVKANSIIVTTEEATSLQVNDANGARAKLSVKGNYRQQTREGFNLLNVPAEYEVSKNYKRVVNSFEAGTYTIKATSVTTDNDTIERFLLAFEDEAGATFGQSFLYKTTLKTTATLSKKAVAVRIYSADNWDNTAVTTTTFKELMIYSGTEEKSYEEYGKMPSREFPTEVETVGGDINILDNVAKTRTINGITFTVNKDGSATAKGTATAQAVLYLTSENNSATYKNIEKGKYTLNGCDDGNTNTYFIQVALENANPSNGAKYFSNYSIPTTFEVQEDNNRYYCMIVIKSGVTIDKTFYPSLIKGYKTVGYSRPGQAGISVKKISKNFANTSILKALNLDAIEINSKNSFTIDLSKGNLVDIQNRKNILFDAPKNKQYTLSYHVEQNNTAFLPGLGFLYSDGSTQIAAKQTDASYNTQVTSQEGKKIEGIYLSWGTQNSGGIATISNIQLETGTQKTDFEEYTEEIKTVDIQQEMLTGDYFDLERKKEVHTWNVQELTGNESWATEGDLEKVMRIATSTRKTSNNYVGVCTHFDFIGNYYLDEEHVYVTNPGTMYVFIDKTVASTPAEFKTFLTEQATAGTPVKVYWKSDTTTELDLTETQIEQLEQLNKMRTYKEQTNIVTVEDLALMQLEYSADIQKYIDNKLANINQQILNLAGGN